MESVKIMSSYDGFYYPQQSVEVSEPYYEEVPIKLFSYEMPIKPVYDAPVKAPCGCEKCQEAQYQTIAVKVSPQSETPPNPDQIQSIAPENIRVTPTTENPKTANPNPSVVVAQTQQTATPTQEKSNWKSWLVIGVASAVVLTAICVGSSQATSPTPQSE
jgi:hypothetical protein